METFGLVVFIVVALGFDYTNGFHDAANAIATTVSTRALRPRTALALAAVMNLLGAHISTAVANTVGGVISPPAGSHGLALVAAGVLGAIAWNLVTWWFGIPSSSSHALIGGLVGAALAGGAGVHWHAIQKKVLVPMVVSPVVGAVLGFAFMLLLLWLFKPVNPHRAKRGFRVGQIVAAAAMSLGHGLQDAQKTMGVITLALVTTGHLSHFAVPFWVVLACALSLSAGTYAGGYRIMRTLGRRVFKLDSTSGFAAQTVASGVLYATSHWGLPVSTTHVVTSSLTGVGATRSLSAVRWNIAGGIVVAWVVTLPAAGLAGALAYAVVNVLA
ncbi:PiT family inorganic phosphate transporter [Motilibacter rhizosphaerae]|uniref:PiT family inorganic phosphate transporter n=1 Tax=Motilibacter rhizosphaerae TaxID=598652 RepID=A0A4Q7NS92_9ACTN|nr:inorganic phosphate transporter [Motilibacter rhizosphaerae]RZS89993.1 PiT family inorganic phosphate transporter [Motilibacter rhizosphaerae]